MRSATFDLGDAEKALGRAKQAMNDATSGSYHRDSYPERAPLLAVAAEIIAARMLVEAAIKRCPDLGVEIERLLKVSS